MVARGALARVCRLDVSIDDTHLATFIADGLVVASPTGSTGYSFSAGGPILDPVSRNLVVTPIAAYLSAIRSVVVSPRQTVRCTVVDAHEALVSVDGREDIPLAVGDVVEVRAVERPIRLDRAQRRAAVLGPPAPQGGAAAVVTGRLLELTVTDLALIERVRLVARRRASTSSPARPARARACSSTRSGSRSGRAPTRRSSATARRAPGSRRCSTGSPSRSSPSARWPPAGARRPGSTTRRSRPRGSPTRSGRSSRSTASTTSSACSTSAGSATCSTRSAGTRRCAGPWRPPSSAWRANRTALDELVVDPRELARRLEVLEHEAAEIAAARLRPGEADEIRARLAAAQHGEAIARGSAAVHEALTADGGAREAVAGAVREARAIARLDSRFDGLAERLAGLEAELEDVAAESRTLAETVDHDPASLAALEERLGVIYSLERRYGDDEAAVIAHGERSAAEAERLRGVDGERARREADDERLLAAVGFAAAALSSARVEAAGRLVGGRGRRSSSTSGSPRACSRSRSAAGPPGRGRRRWSSTATRSPSMPPASTRSSTASPRTPGEPARPLARIASGGELSRVALAIKQVLAEADATPTLVFDEVDTGIGGRSADPVGRSLWTLARRHQVLCVTHLPQIAAHADAQFRISKRERDGRTVTEVERLDREGRIVELSQMLGSGAGAAAGLAAARELLDRAEAWRGASATVG